MVTSSVLSCKPLKDTQNMLLRLDRQIGTNFGRLLQAAAATVAHAAQTRCNDDEDRNQMPRNSMLDQALTRLIAHRSKFPSASRRQHLSCRLMDIPRLENSLVTWEVPGARSASALSASVRFDVGSQISTVPLQAQAAVANTVAPENPGVRRTNGPTSPTIRRCSSPERELQRRRP